MRCVVVNGAHLKAETSCAHCGDKIGQSYVREIGSRLIYCDFQCYRAAVENALAVLSSRVPALGAWTRRS
jgi:hypothetical protein